MEPDDAAFGYDGNRRHSPGMTKREYIATAILQGLRASGMAFGYEEFAEIAVEQTDALIAALNAKDA